MKLSLNTLWTLSSVLPLSTTLVEAIEFLSWVETQDTEAVEMTFDDKEIIEMLWETFEEQKKLKVEMYRDDENCIKDRIGDLYDIGREDGHAEAAEAAEAAGD
jgi:hypothetical protein